MECVLYHQRSKFFSSCSLVIRSTDAFVSTRVVGLRTWKWTDNAPYCFPCLPLGLRPKPRVRFVHTAKRTMTQMPLFGGVSFSRQQFALIWKTLQVQTVVLFINHSAPILVRSHQNIKVGCLKDWEWALEKGRFGPHFSRVKADYFQSSSHLKAFFKKTSSLDHL